LRTVGHTETSSLELGNASGDIDLCIGSQRVAEVPSVVATGVGETPQSKPSRGKRKPKK
jgi:hypothetical protein